MIGWGTSAALNMHVIELSYLDIQDIGAATPEIGAVASVGSSAWTDVLDGEGEPVKVAERSACRATSSSCSARCRCCGRMIRPDDDRTNERARWS